MKRLYQIIFGKKAQWAWLLADALLAAGFWAFGEYGWFVFALILFGLQSVVVGFDIWAKWKIERR